jgi:hypothetical protein
MESGSLRGVSKNVMPCSSQSELRSNCPEDNCQLPCGLRMTRQARKGERGMPGRQRPKKDVAHCEKRRGVVCRQRTGDVRMGKPGRETHGHLLGEHITQEGGTRGTETS